ncbi:MAG: cofactor-independent phosphoglycerate mutase [Sedimentisphaeraceae bacterium JB056]
MRKYVIIVPDGAADDPIEMFDGKTVIEAADIPNIDKLSENGRLALVHTIPEGMTPGSDVAQMTLLGYDPKQFYTGRAPIEAVAQDIELDEDQFVFRCNLVTFADDKMADHSAGHISTEEGRQIVELLQANLGSENVTFYPGVSYRHLCVISGINFDLETIPPHDVIGSAVEDILPKGEGADFIKDLMERSQELIAECDVNRVRQDLGENPVSSIWLWGQGTKASMEIFETKYGLKGAAITAVDLVRGIAKLTGLDVIEVEGATGLADTNYEGKTQAAIDALKDHDFVFVHLEGPDEAGHSGDAELKKTALERIDAKVVGPLIEELEKYGDWRMMVMPDHPTPVATRGHTSDPVPVVIGGAEIESRMQKPFSEQNAKESGFVIKQGYELMEYFVKR